MRETLVFVYNADSGLFNTVADIAHKALSPSTYACNLCALTHGTFTVRGEWLEFLRTLDADCEFLHRDEFHAAYGLRDIALPAILRHAPSGPELWIDAAALRACRSLDELRALILSGGRRC